MLTGGETAGFFRGNRPGKRQDGLDHAGFGRQPGVQGETGEDTMLALKHQQLSVLSAKQHISSILGWSCLSLSFKVYIAKVDPTSSLGLSTDSIYSYSVGHIRRVLGGEAHETLPSRCISRGPSGITLALKGPSSNDL